MSLKEPHLKMSKSHLDPRSRIHITDDPETVSEKLKLALTDSQTGVSFDSADRPGVSNILAIMSHLDHKNRSAKDLAHLFASGSMRDFKAEAARVVSDGLANIRERYECLITEKSSHHLKEIAHVGSIKAQGLAKRTMSRVRDALGLD